MTHILSEKKKISEFIDHLEHNNTSFKLVCIALRDDKDIYPSHNYSVTVWNPKEINGGKIESHFIFKYKKDALKAVDEVTEGASINGFNPKVVFEDGDVKFAKGGLVEPSKEYLEKEGYNFKEAPDAEKNIGTFWKMYKTEDANDSGQFVTDLHIMNLAKKLGFSHKSLDAISDEPLMSYYIIRKNGKEVVAELPAYVVAPESAERISKWEYDKFMEDLWGSDEGRGSKNKKYADGGSVSDSGTKSSMIYYLVKKDDKQGGITEYALELPAHASAPFDSKEITKEEYEKFAHNFKNHFYADGGFVGGMLRFVTEQLSGGYIGARLHDMGYKNGLDYKQIDSVRKSMVAILQEHGDEAYSIRAANKLIADAALIVLGKPNSVESASVGEIHRFEKGGKMNSSKYENYLTTSSSEIIRNTLNKVNEILAEDEGNAGFTKVTLPSITYIDKEKSVGADGLPHEWLVIYYGDEDIAMINENEIKKHDISNAKVKLIADYVKANEQVGHFKKGGSIGGTYFITGLTMSMWGGEMRLMDEPKYSEELECSLDRAIEIAEEMIKEHVEVKEVKIIKVGKSVLQNKLAAKVYPDKVEHFEDGGTVGAGYVDISFVQPSKITTRETLAFGSPDKFILDYNGKKIAQFFYNMRGYIQDFILKNKENVQYGFSREIGKAKQLADFKRALKEGYVYIKLTDKYAKGGHLNSVGSDMSDQMFGADPTYSQADFIAENNAEPTVYTATQFDERMAKGGSIKHHKHIKTLTIELLEPTDKGWKVMEKDPNGIGKVKKGKISFYSNAEIKDLFADKEGGEKFAKGGSVSDELKELLGKIHGSSVFPASVTDAIEIVKERLSSVTNPNAEAEAKAKKKKLEADGFAVKSQKLDYTDLGRGVVYAITAIKKKESEGGKFENGGAVESESHVYKLGDKYRDDFDTDGLFELAKTVDASWSVEDLQKLFRSFEDVNYHLQANLLNSYIKAIKSNSQSPESLLEDFKASLEDEEDEVEEANDIIEEPYYVVGKKDKQLVDITELPMTKSDCERWVKEQGVEKHYADVAIIPYHGKKPIFRYAKGGAVGKYKVGDEVVVWHGIHGIYGQIIDVATHTLGGLKYKVQKENGNTAWESARNLKPSEQKTVSLVEGVNAEILAIENTIESVQELIKDAKSDGDKSFVEEMDLTLAALKSNLDTLKKRKHFIEKKSWLSADKYDLRHHAGTDLVTMFRDFFVNMGGKVEKDRFMNFINGLQPAPKKMYMDAWKEYKKLGDVYEKDGLFINPIIAD